MNIKECNIILASGSPRRKELLMQVGLEFKVITSDCEEIIREKLPGELVKQLSCDKAMAVLNQNKDKISGNTLVIGADTVVAVDGRILGKPKSDKEAIEMISLIKNRSHSVFTGVTIIYNGEKENVVRSFFCETRVFVYDMSEDEIFEYVNSKEPMDKAGGYGIQGRFSAYIEKIEGDYFNVVGLPVSRLLQEIKLI